MNNDPTHGIYDTNGKKSTSSSLPVDVMKIISLIRHFSFLFFFFSPQCNLLVQIVCMCDVMIPVEFKCQQLRWRRSYQNPFITLQTSIYNFILLVDSMRCDSESIEWWWYDDDDDDAKNHCEISLSLPLYITSVNWRLKMCARELKVLWSGILTSIAFANTLTLMPQRT